MIQKMINFDLTKEETKEHNHPYGILIIGGSGSGKTYSFFNLIIQQPDTDKIYLYAKDPYEAKCQFLISKPKRTGLKHFNDSKVFIESSNDMDDIKILKNIIQIKNIKY